MYTLSRKILLIIILATIFGLASGVVGTLLTRVYLLEESFDLPFFGEINLAGTNYDGYNVVISNPKKVVVEQNTRVLEVIKTAKNSVVGIFKRKAMEAKVGKFSLDNYYQIEKADGQGVIVTSDGWVVSNFSPTNYKGFDPQDVASDFDYVIITYDKKVYPVKQIIVSEKGDYSFWKISANDLPVKKFVSRGEIDTGELLVGVNWQDEVKTATIYDITEDNNKAIKSSDNFWEKIILSDVAPELTNGFFFDLNGSLAALTDNTGIVRPIYNYLACINCVLNGQKISSARLGVNYINLSELISAEDQGKMLGVLVVADTSGAAVEKDSPADLAGIKAGDIILSINNITLDENNDLAQVISQYKAGQDAALLIERQGERSLIELTLGE